MKISEIIGTYTLGPLKMGSESLSFRVEIHQELGKTKKLFARIWRYENYRLQSTFPQSSGQPLHEPSDETIMIEELAFKTGSENYAESSFSVLERVMQEMANRFKNDRGISRNLQLLKEHLVKKKAVSGSKSKGRRKNA